MDDEYDDAELEDEDDYDDSGVDVKALEAADQLAADNPMPRELRDRIADWIEPHTLNCDIKHRDVMDAIDLAFPLIRDWLAAQLR